jgi:hypothetical protein
MDMNIKIIVADDFPEVTRVIRNILKNIGFTNLIHAYISFIDNDCTIVYANLNQIRGLYPFFAYFSKTWQ